MVWKPATNWLNNILVKNLQTFCVYLQWRLWQQQDWLWIQLLRKTRSFVRRRKLRLQNLSRLPSRRSSGHLEVSKADSFQQLSWRLWLGKQGKMNRFKRLRGRSSQGYTDFYLPFDKMTTPHISTFYYRLIRVVCLYIRKNTLKATSKARVDTAASRADMGNKTVTAVNKAVTVDNSRVGTEHNKQTMGNSNTDGDEKLAFCVKLACDKLFYTFHCFYTGCSMTKTAY